MTTTQELRGSRLFVGLKGCEVECLSPDGEIRWALGVTAGVHVAEKYAEYMGLGDTLRLNGPATLLYRGGRIQSQSFGPVAFESGANPNFQPSVFTEAEVRMRKMLDQATKSEQRLAKREAALVALMKQTPSTDVIDDGDTGEDPEIVEEPEPAPAKPGKGDVAADE